MALEQYIYEAMSVHLREKEMLSETELERLSNAGDINEAYAILGEKGWETAGLEPSDADAIIAAQREKTRALVEALIGRDTPANTLFSVLFCAYDYHNLKAAVKLAYLQSDWTDTGRYFINGGMVDTGIIIAAARSRDFTALAPDMAEAGKAAYETLARTGNGQYCDMIIDKASLIAVYKAGCESGSEMLKRYAELTVDGANIKAAVRCAIMGKESGFIERAVAPAGSLDTQMLIDAATEGLETLYGYLRHTEYHTLTGEPEKGMAAFERCLDNLIIQMIRPQRNNFFSIEPIAAYIIARDIELRMVKLILTALINNLEISAVRERLRETYV